MLVLGMNAKLYIDEVLVGNATNVTLNLTSEEADVTTRGNNGWKANVPTLKDASVELEMIWDTDDAQFQKVKDSYLNGTDLDVKVLDGLVDADGEGLHATMRCSNLTREEPLTDALKCKVTLKPTYDAVSPPEWIGGSDSGSGS